MDKFVIAFGITHVVFRHYMRDTLINIYLAKHLLFNDALSFRNHPSLALCNDILTSEGKVKLSLGDWRHSSTIFHLGTRWRWMVSFTSVESGWATEMFWKENKKNSLPLPQIEHRASSTPSLYRVTYPGSFNM
jgi:hypothetical protein